jgi:CDP-diacylglycerol---serine O-phosphatidyltransferase
MTLRDRLVDPRSPERRPRKAAYALPTLFTAGNIFLGYISILRCFRGAMLTAAGQPGAPEQFVVAAQAIGAAVFLDGLDGRIARMTNTTSDFGREMDSLADVISFGIAPAFLAWAWGVNFVGAGLAQAFRDNIHNTGAFLSFLFLICGAARLARFNIQHNPIPKNPGRPDRKYFVGLAIPAGASVIASIVFACSGEPVTWWPISIAWMALLVVLGFLMVSTWRYYSFKGINLNKAYSPLILIVFAAFIYGIWNYAKVLFVIMALGYMSSGIIIRFGGIIRRRMRHGEHKV